MFDPGHPDANADGYVAYPNVNLAVEMVNLISAQRAYEANVNVILAGRRMGDKAEARRSMIAAGVATVPGSDGIIETVEEAAEVAQAIGYPVLVKASAGGGGRGMRVVNEPEELADQFERELQEKTQEFEGMIRGIVRNEHIQKPLEVGTEKLKQERKAEKGKADNEKAEKEQQDILASPCPALGKHSPTHLHQQHRKL